MLVNIDTNDHFFYKRAQYIEHAVDLTQQKNNYSNSKIFILLLCIIEIFYTIIFLLGKRFFIPSTQAIHYKLVIFLMSFHIFAILILLSFNIENIILENIISCIMHAICMNYGLLHIYMNNPIVEKDTINLSFFSQILKIYYIQCIVFILFAIEIIRMYIHYEYDMIRYLLYLLPYIILNPFI